MAETRAFGNGGRKGAAFGLLGAILLVAGLLRVWSASGDLWLDENGYRMLAALERAAGPNRSLLAAVHRARAEIAANPALARLPFDKVVSAVARISELPVLAPCGAADATAPEDPGPASLRLEMAPPALPPSGKTRR